MDNQSVATAVAAGDTASGMTDEEYEKLNLMVGGKKGMSGIARANMAGFDEEEDRLITCFEEYA